MTRIGLVSCVKAKRTTAAPAGVLYTSPLFRAFRAYAEARTDSWYVLSAEHGLLRPDDVIHPYNKTLNEMPKAMRRAWGERVWQQLLEVLPARAEIVVLAGNRYREHVVPALRAAGHVVSVPLEGKRLGEQLRWLKQTFAPAETHER